MGAGDGLLATFARALRNEDLDGEAVAAMLFGALEAEREEAGIADIWWYGRSVEMELGNGEHWAIECLGANAFRLYPGIVRDESVTWLNLWVVADYSVEELIGRLNEVAGSAKGK